ncbi:MAG: Asp-tRNA(Asn)/Glu-tRNA(Gln) amidotransferase subunit GatB [Gammaproteobacteria bacterium]|jgi:aspartyl-tRNA(Asn)/glutamyl-tRNA(Gln) amidotransferase subunit B
MKNIDNNWEAVIGLEVHAQLTTKSKIFSGAATNYGAEPNTQACAIDLGLPGVLPVLNIEVVTMAVKFGLAISAQISTKSVFARKNYFYPDLPKGYQISQYEEPIVTNGSLDIVTLDQPKTIRIQRAHLEEDAGKSLHEDFHGYTGVDLNRAGTPLLEIVSEPDLRSAQEAVSYLKALHSLVKYLDICDGNMQEGSFRCDANISVRPKNSTTFGTRVEVKNLNSFKFIEKAINYEINRQITAITNGEKILQETRLYDVNNNITKVMRSKEEANDYRYFPDPDLLPVYLEQEFINNIKKNLPELAPQKSLRFQQQYNLSAYEANLLTASRDLAIFYENTISYAKANNNLNLTKLTANWIIGELLAALNKHDLELNKSPITPEILAKLIIRIADNTISGKIAKQIFEIAWNTPNDPDLIIQQHSLVQLTDHSAIEKLIDQIITDFPKQVAEYKNGKEQLFGFFVGQIMKVSKGKANPDLVNQLLKQKLQ